MGGLGVRGGLMSDVCDVSFYDYEGGAVVVRGVSVHEVLKRESASHVFFMFRRSCIQRLVVGFL